MLFQLPLRISALPYPLFLPEKCDETEEAFPFSSDMSCWDINTLLHLRACLEPPSLEPVITALLCQFYMVHCHIPVLFSLLPSLLFKVSLLPGEPAPLSHPLPPQIFCTGQWSLMASCINFIWTSCSVLETCITTRTKSSPVIHIWSSTKFPQVWEGTNFSGSFLCAWGTDKVHLDPPASSETWLYGIFSSPQAGGISLPIYHCESYRNQVFKPPSLYPTGEIVWQCQKLLGGMDRHTESGQAKSKSVLWTWTHESPLWLGYRERSWGFHLYSRTQQSWDGLQRWLFAVRSSK